MSTVPKEEVIRANNGPTKQFLRILFFYSFLGSGACGYTGYVFFKEGNTVLGAGILSCVLLYLVYRIWRHFFKEINDRKRIISKVKEDLYYTDIHRSMNGEKPLNITLK